MSTDALSAGHARALLSLGDGRQIERLARECVAHGWSVREVERHARGTPSRGKKGGRAARRGVPPEVARIEAALGKTESVEKKPEFYQQQAASAKQRLGGL